MFTCRPETPEDEPFVRDLILDTISAELGASAWPEPMRGHLLAIQCQGRRHSGGQSLIILHHGDAVGWLLLAALPFEIRLIEIMVAGTMQGMGIGSGVIREVLESARAQGLPLRLSVNVTNERAVKLYLRLGFRPVENDEVQLRMEALP